MKKLMMVLVITAAAPAAAFADHGQIAMLGTVARECDGYYLTAEDSCLKYRLIGDVCHLTGRRAEIVGRLMRGGLCVTAAYVLLPRCSDLVVAVHVRYGGSGEAFVGYMPNGCFDSAQVRFARRVRCGDRVEVRIPVRREEARHGASYRVVMWAVERRIVRNRCGMRSVVTAIRHEESDAFTYRRGRWSACSPRIDLCL